MRFLLHIAAAIAAVAMFSACNACNAGTETRAEEAAQCATEAAQRLIDTNHADTMALQHSILDAKAIQSEYVLAGDTAAVRAFDVAFRAKLRADDPELADAVF